MKPHSKTSHHNTRHSEYQLILPLIALGILVVTQPTSLEIQAPLTCWR